jgi:hypothetical protein
MTPCMYAGAGQTRFHRLPAFASHKVDTFEPFISSCLSLHLLLYIFHHEASYSNDAPLAPSQSGNGSGDTS